MPVHDLPSGLRWSLEIMGMIYVAVAVLFVVNPDYPILLANKAFGRFNWPPVFFPTERFWHSLAVSVPGTRAFLAFSAARRPAQARIYLGVLQVSLLLAAVMFAKEFVFGRHAALYALGFFVESVQVVFYLLLNRKLP